MNKIVHLIIYLAYRLLQSFTSAIYRASGSHRGCYRGLIIWRKKYKHHDLGRNVDFITSLPESVDPAVLVIDEGWSVYSMDRHHIYLVRTQQPLTALNAQIHPFARGAQFMLAKEFAWLPRNDFLTLVQTQVHDRSQQIVVCSNHARSGSTLLTAMVHSENFSIVGIAEPCDALAYLAYLGKCGRNTVEEVGRMSNAILNFSARSLANEATLFYNLRSASNAITLGLHVVNPKIRHVFSYRQDISRTIQSTERMLTSGLDTLWVTIHHFSQRLSDWIIGYQKALYGIWQTNPQDMQDISTFQVALALQPFSQTNNKISYYTVSYEDLIGSPAKTMADLMKFVVNLEPSKKVIDDALQVMQRDSQANDAVMARGVQSSFRAADITQKTRNYLRRLVEVMQLGNIVDLDTMCIIV